MLTADQKTRLRRVLDAFLEEDTPRADALRRVAQELAVIPITDDWNRDFGIRLSDGKVVSFNRNEPFDVQVVDVPNAEIAVLGHAWMRFSELAPLVPVRPSHAIDCPACDGSGLSRHGKRPSGFSCYCGGLGWLLPDGWITKTGG
jgi:hypothetical protein